MGACNVVKLAICSQNGSNYAAVEVDNRPHVCYVRREVGVGEICPTIARGSDEGDDRVLSGALGNRARVGGLMRWTKVAGSAKWTNVGKGR